MFVTAEDRHIATGGASAAAATIALHFVSLPYLDETPGAALAFFSGYWLAGRKWPADPPRERFAPRDSRPAWLVIARRAAVVASVLAYFIAYRLAFLADLHGLPRKLSALAAATAALLLGFRLTRAAD